VVFVIGSDTSLEWILKSVADGTCWRIERVPSISVLLGRRTFAPRCLVLDISQRNSDDFLIEQWPNDMPVVCVADVCDVALCVHAMKAGAIDVLAKPFGSALLLEAVRLALNLSQVVLRTELELNGIRQRYASLSRRECEVMALVVSGLLNKQVARELGISEVTVKAHRGRVMRKMKAQSLASLVMTAARLRPTQYEGLAPPARHLPQFQWRADQPHLRQSGYPL